MMITKYKNRQHAGALLAQHLLSYQHHHNAILLALPRGGVPVAFEIASVLSIPLDVFIVRKLGVPWHPEYAMGALASGGMVILNQSVISSLNIPQVEIERVIRAEQAELVRREQVYRGLRDFPDLNQKTIILVDDGIATGYTMRAAVEALHQYHPYNLVIAVPVAARATCIELASLVDELICPLQPEQLIAVGAWYEHFSQTTDEEVLQLLKQSGEVGI